MEKLFTVEELIADDSFIHYCNRSNTTAVSFWEAYLLLHPGEKQTVDEAKAFVNGLRHMLGTEEKEKALQTFQSALEARYQTAPVRETFSNAHIKSARQRPLYRWAAAACVAGFIALGIWISADKEPAKTATFSKPHIDSTTAQPVALASNAQAETSAGEKKTVLLPDGTKVTLNAKTILKIDGSFGGETRLVTLEGEAFFDVAHNAARPFIVRLATFDVKVLGTMFNVRAYKDDPTSEAALVNGKVEIVLKNKPGKKLYLVPNQKAIVSNSGRKAGAVPGEGESSASPVAKVAVKPLTISADGNAIVETAWMKNRLEINDETFAELKNKLERWYGVQLTFTSEAVKQYRFTATFEGETIDQALTALRLSYPFSYTKKEKEILIGKE